MRLSEMNFLNVTNNKISILLNYEKFNNLLNIITIFKKRFNLKNDFLYLCTLIRNCNIAAFFAKKKSKTNTC